MRNLLRRLIELKRGVEMLPGRHEARATVVLTKRTADLEAVKVRELTPEEAIEQELRWSQLPY